jgi:predicted DNA-binding protein YlxM (UPF0122 family)
MTTNDLIDKSINTVLTECPKRHKYYINSLSIVELIDLFEELINFSDVAVYDMVLNGEMIALPYIGRLKIKEGTKNAKLIYDILFEKYSINDINDVTPEIQEKIKSDFKQEFLKFMPTKSQAQMKDELMLKINENLAKSLFNT